MESIDLLRYITWYATQLGIKLSTNRLIKFLYLADLYQARLKDGETITGFPWRFIYYGPYCSEAWQCIEKATEKGLILKETFTINFAQEPDYHLFSCYAPEAEKLGNLFHIGVLSQLQSAIKKFGDETALLLDYVYFETEPMKRVRKGDLLDFSTASMPDVPKSVQLRKIPNYKIRLAREKIKLLREQQKADRQKLIQEERNLEKFKDESYYKFIELMDGEELETGLKGKAKIRMPQ